MALKDTIKHMRELLANITADLEKADNGNKAASQRVRTGTVKLEKTAKAYRKESIKHEKSSVGGKKSKKEAKPKAKVAAAKAKAPAKPAAKAKVLKAAPKAKIHKAKPKALSFNRPSAKLPAKKAGSR